MILQDISNPIVFSAFKTAGKRYYTGDYLDNYDGFLTNYGNSFSLESGIFTSPRQGIFEFSASVAHAYGVIGYNSLWIERNNMEFGILQFNSDAKTSGGGDTLSFSWIMELQQGDTIRLKVSAGEFEAYYEYNWTFNGKFIRDI